MPEMLLQGSYGIQKSTLDQITATAGNVQSGVKFLDKNGNIQTGTLSLSGNAGTGDVKSGKTFYSNSWTKKTGTLALSGNASTSQVLSGRTFYSNSWTKQTGTMVNRGAVSKSINPGSSYTIPAGYHNGSGKVTAKNPASGWKMRYFGGNADNNYHSQRIGAPDGNGTYAWGCSGYVYWGNENTHLAFDFQGQSYPDKMGNYNNFMFYGTNYFDSKTTLGYRIWGGNLNFYYCRVR